MTDEQKTMNALLEIYDYYIRLIGSDRDEYYCGYADAAGQCILDIGKIYGEKFGEKSYKFEAYKRVMQFESIEQYKRDYPKIFKWR